MSDHIPDQNAMSICFSKGITISPVAIDGKQYKIQMNGKQGSQMYTEKEVWEKIKEMYKHYAGT